MHELVLYHEPCGSRDAHMQLSTTDKGAEGGTTQTTTSTQHSCKQQAMPKGSHSAPQEGRRFRGFSTHSPTQGNFAAFVQSTQSVHIALLRRFMSQFRGFDIYA